MGITRRNSKTLIVAISAALSAPGIGVVHAQTNASTSTQPAKTLQTVVVTGSRIPRPELIKPTLTVPISNQELQLHTQPNLGAALDKIPYFAGGNRPQTNSSNNNEGGNAVDLRGLGAVRTLPLLDGQRFSISGKLNVVPSILIQRIDVITGGASATWGSGAVSGVVNIVLNKNLNGLKASASYGQTTHSIQPDPGRKIAGAFGHDYAGGKGHFIVGFDWLERKGITPRVGTRPNVGGWDTIALPNGRLLLSPNVNTANMSFGGLITSGVLKGKQFNPNGTLRDFQYGVLNDGTSMIGGDKAAGNTDAYSPLVTPQKHYAMLARTRYDLTNNLRLTVQLRHSKIWNDTPEWLDSNAGNITIHSDNAFLSPEIKQIMKQAGEDTFMLGRENKDINPPRNIYRNLATQFTVGLKGAFGDDWQWSSYVSHAEQNNLFRDPGFLLNDNWHFAVNSIIDPVTGKPVCKIALDYPDTTCVPIDLFGQGAASQAARDYVVGQRLFDDKTTLNVASITANGPVAQLPAGKAFVAVGLDWRRLGTNQTVGPDAAAGRLRTTSFEPLSGAFHVSEAFGEFNAPLLAGVPGFQHSDIDLATRFSRYSEAGNVWSWKAAAEDEFIHGFRFRASYSRDIRAPNIGELFSGHHTGFDFGTDPFTGKTGRIKIVSGGNPNLKPETSNTFSAGITMAPHGQQGINVSVDYYDIKIKNVIIGPNPFLLFKRCGLEQAAACARIIRFPNGDLNFIQDTNINLDKYSTDGVDIAVSYRKPITLFGHTVTMSSRTLATWVHRFDTSNGLIKSALVGNTGNSFSSLGAPRWRAISFFTLSAARWAGTVRARYVSPSYYDRNQDIVNNRLGGWLVWGLQGSYKFGPSLNWSAFVNVDNLTDRAAPHGTTFSAFYNDIGRYITVGLRYGF